MLVTEGQTGVCGATVGTIAARNFARAVPAGSAPHSEHGRDMAFILKAAATGQARDYKIRDPCKLFSVAETLVVLTQGRPVEEIASDVADIAISQFGQLPPAGREDRSRVAFPAGPAQREPRRA